MEHDPLENIETGEDDFHFKKGEYSLKEIILRHIRKISDLTCQELTPGYWQRTPVKVGGGVIMSESYHPDLRESYINAVDFLLDVIMPNVIEEEDKDFKLVLVKLDEAQKKSFELFSNGEGNQDGWTREKLKLRRKLFSEIMLFLSRINFFGGEESYTEKA